MIRRLRVVLPPASSLVTFVLGYALAHLPALLAAQQWRVPPPPEAVWVRVMVHVLALVSYGVFRVAAFHPFYRGGYRRWLETTPWAWPKPLPVGPIPLVLADAVVFLAAGLPAWAQGDLDPLVSLSILLGAYLLTLAPTLWGTGEWALAYAVMFAVGLAIRLWASPPWIPAGAMMAGYVLGMLGLRRSLRRWPWTLDWKDDLARQMTQVQAGEAGPSARRLGWPFDRLGPRFPTDPGRVTLRHGVLTSLLAGWWFHAIQSTLHGEGPAILAAMVLGQGAFFGAMIRLSRYVTGYDPPIGVVGRIATLRWVIPSYDQVFVSPLIALLVAWAGPFGLRALGLPVTVAAPAALSLALMALLLGGPDLRAWWLTARHRVVPAVKAAGGFIEVG